MVLLRLERSEDIKRLGRVLYLLPKTHPTLGPLHPRPGAVLAALTRRDGTEFKEHESYAANRLRLTEQVPARHIYLTPGRSRVVHAGPLTIELRHRSPRKLDSPAPMSARVFAALRNIGKRHVTPEQLIPLRMLLSGKDR